MAKTNSSPEDEICRMAAEIADQIKHWEYLKIHGGSDPLWEDGVNMNLTRNHVLSYKKQIEEICNESGLPFPAEYSLPTPPEVDDDYMARTEEIRASAKLTLKLYQDNPDYAFLMENADSCQGNRQRVQLSISLVLGYVSNLKAAIKNYDYITMRRHENTITHYEDSFRKCRERVEEVLATKPKEPVQMALF
jgi:hypothetical protein